MLIDEWESDIAHSELAWTVGMDFMRPRDIESKELAGHGELAGATAMGGILSIVESHCLA